MQKNGVNGVYIIKSITYFIIYFQKNGNSKFVGYYETKKLSFDVFLASLAKSNHSIDLLKELNVAKDNRRESVGKTYIISFHN